MTDRADSATEQRGAVVFPDPRTADENGVVAVGDDFRVTTLRSAYTSGIFPWPHKVGRRTLVLWCSPEPRCIFDLAAAPHWSRSLRRTLRGVGRTSGFRITLDQAFPEVMHQCGATRPDGTWITKPLLAGYVELFAQGFAHSVEVWRDEQLVGGIYGVAFGGLFAGESMFFRETDASKVAFASLVEALRAAGYTLFDVQVRNEHLISLGCEEISREDYLARLRLAQCAQPQSLTLVTAKPSQRNT